MSVPGGEPSSRLERALGAWLEHEASGAADPGELLAAHPDLRELLEPMLARGRGAVDEGARVVGDFRLGAELGRGGMGIVYEAWQQSLGRKVALKVLAPALAADPGAIARFHREAAAAAKLRHPGIVEIHDVGCDAELHWFAMTLVEGEPLHRCRERFAAPAAAVGVLTQVLDALQHAHAAGLVHRDVKPANILVRADGSVVLTDFGLAREVSSPTLTAEGGFLGTLDYAAPEQIQAQKVDARADVWSAAVVLAELLTGRHPFARATATATLRAILTEEPAGIGAREPLAADLRAIVLRALEKDPGRRYASAVAFLADLRAFEQGLPVSARLPSPTERLRRWARREPWRAFAGLLLLAGIPLLAGIGGYLWANAPRIAAAARAETERQREQAITNAWLSLADERYEEGLLELAPWTAPDDLEAGFTRISLLVQAKQIDEARAALRGFAGHRLAELVALLLDAEDAALPFRFDQVEADSPLECAALGQLAFEQVRAHGRDPSFLGHAARWYGRAVALSPAPRAWLLFWWVVTAGRAREDAALSTALAAYEHHFPGSRGLHLAYVFAASRVPVERGLERVAALDLEANPRLQFARGQLLARAGRRTEAIAAYEIALAAQPDNAQGWTHLARQRFLAADYEGSVAAARRALAVAAGLGEAAGLAGAALQQLRRFAEAKPMLELAAELEPRDWMHFQNLGLALHELRLDEAALAAFQKAAVLAPTETGPRACMARTLRRLDRHEEAFVAEVQAMPFTTADDWRHAMTVATRAMEVGLHATARRQATRATEIAPERAQTWWRLAEAHLEAEPVDAARAAAAVAAALERDPTPAPRELVLQARSEAASGAVQAAIEHFEAALADPEKIPPILRAKAERELARLRGQ
jgi:tetratricopeptide (TPR) repeat protein